MKPARERHIRTADVPEKYAGPGQTLREVMGGDAADAPDAEKGRIHTAALRAGLGGKDEVLHTEAADALAATDRLKQRMVHELLHGVALTGAEAAAEDRADRSREAALHPPIEPVAGGGLDRLKRERDSVGGVQAPMVDPLGAAMTALETGTETELRNRAAVGFETTELRSVYKRNHAVRGIAEELRESAGGECTFIHPGNTPAEHAEYFEGLRKLIDEMKRAHHVDLVEIEPGRYHRLIEGYQGRWLFLDAVPLLGKNKEEASNKAVQYAGVTRRICGMMLLADAFKTDPLQPAVQAMAHNLDVMDDDPARAKEAISRLDAWTTVLERPGTMRDTLLRVLRETAAERWRNRFPTGWNAVARHRERIQILAGATRLAEHGSGTARMQREILDAMRQARLYTFPVARVAALWEEVNRYVLDVTSGIREEHGAFFPEYRTKRGGRFLEHLTADGHDPRTMNLDAIEALAGALPALTELPFPTIAILPEQPLGLGMITAATLKMHTVMAGELPKGVPAANGVRMAAFDGFLLTRAGDVFLIVAYVDIDGQERMSPIELRRAKGGFAPDVGKNEAWLWAGSLFPWLAYALVAVIADCREFILRVDREDDAEEDDKEKARKKRAPTHTPQPYYQLTLDDVIVVDRLRAHAGRLGWVDAEGRRIRIHRGWSHQWDVPAHDRVYVRRGSAWTDAEVRLWKGRGYTVYGPGAVMDDDDYARLIRRGHARPAPDEWLALRKIRVRDHRKGPEDKPYIPARRHVVGGDLPSV